MCGRGSMCMYCSREAILVMHWPSWAARLCGICAKELKDAKEPEMIVMLDKEGPCPAVS
jgi:hypothetical protein